MISALAAADGIQWLSIFVKALAYAACLVAAGSALIIAGLRAIGENSRRLVVRIAAVTAVLAAIVSGLRIPIRASYLTGGTFDGATDPMLLGMVGESPLGVSITIRLVGLALILALALPYRFGKWVALAGAVLVCASFAFRGHALSEPRLLLGFLITIHILGLAFWTASFAPLFHLSRLSDPGPAARLAHEFGQKAVWAVIGLCAAGALTLGILTGWTGDVLFSPYGQFLALKLALFAGVIGLAALNKLKLTPDLQRGHEGAGRLLRRSIGIEAALVFCILVTTAAFTTLSSPLGS